MTLKIISYGPKSPIVNVYDYGFLYKDREHIPDTIDPDSPCKTLESKSSQASCPHLIRLSSLETSASFEHDASNGTEMTSEPSEWEAFQPPTPTTELPKSHSRADTEISISCSGCFTKTLEDCSETTDQRKVSFSSVQIRDYRLTVGDNVCSTGTPVGLDWEYEEYEPQTVDGYELEREGERRTMYQMYMNSFHREEILRRHGLSDHQIKRGRFASNIARRQRHRSKKWAPFLDAVQSAKCGCKCSTSATSSLALLMKEKEAGYDDDDDDKNDLGEKPLESKEYPKSRRSVVKKEKGNYSSTSCITKYDVNDEERETLLFWIEGLEV